MDFIRILTQKRAHRLGHGNDSVVLPINPRTKQVMKLIASGMRSANVNWINNLDRVVRSSSGVPDSLNILPVMLTNDTLLNTAPVQTNSAISTKAIPFMTRRKNDGRSAFSPPLGRPSSVRRRDAD